MSKSTRYSVSLDYDRSVRDAITDGRYDWADGYITEDHFFPSTRSGKCDIDIELVHFNRVISTEDAVKEMQMQGLRPCELPELLALGATHPDLQREFPIVAVGSVWRYSHRLRFVPYLHRLWCGSERRLDLDWFESVWDEVYRFAAVRK